MISQQQLPTLTIYKASAGSGKTFTLATEYIRHLIEDPQAYRYILAVTFTNKATEEMKMRILSQLYGISRKLPESKAYVEKLRTLIPQKSEDYIAQQAEMALKNLLHNYSFFRVQTIDTFFQSILRHIARELGLESNLKVSLNDAQIEQLAVDKIMEELHERPDVLRWIYEYIWQKLDDKKNWNIVNQIKSFGEQIFKDIYKKNAPTLNKILTNNTLFTQYKNTLYALKRDAEKELVETGEAFFRYLEENGFDIKDLYLKEKGPAGYFIKLKNGLYAGKDLLTKSISTMLEENDENKWISSANKKETFTAYQHRHKLQEMLIEAESTRKKCAKDIISTQLTLRNINQLRLLHVIQEKVMELNKETGRFLLSDTQDLLEALIDHSDSPFIYEKIGTEIKHIMIDEFQDTGTTQWHNFKVLLDNCMSNVGSRNLIVGDVKQSIYRWRAGDWELLNNITDFYPHQQNQLHVETLETNYRSLKNIVDFNNAFFAKAVEMELKELEDQPIQARKLRTAYAQEGICQHAKHTGNEGLVNIELLPYEDYEEQTLKRIVETVDELLAKGIALNDIALILRTNGNIKSIAKYFTEQRPELKIVSDEAFRLESSMAANLLIDAIKWLLNPDDNLTKARLVKAYQCGIKKQTISYNELFIDPEKLDSFLPEYYILNRKSLLRMPFYDLAEELAHLFELHSAVEENAYLCLLFDFIKEFATEGSGMPADFITAWEDEYCTKSIQSDAVDGLRLISIHASKGLEFNTVLIPFCDWSLEITGSTLWCTPSEPPYNLLPMVPVNLYAGQLMQSVYKEDYVEEHFQNMIDNLNLLYVAFTRAKQNLFVWGKRTKTNRSGNTHRTELIKKCLPELPNMLSGSNLSGSDDDEKEAIVFTFGKLSVPTSQPMETAKAKPPTSQHRQKEPPKNVFLQKSISIPVDFQSYRAPVSFLQSNQSKTYLDEKPAGDNDNHYLKLGNILHNVFSKIITTQDIERVLQQLETSGILPLPGMSNKQLKELVIKRVQQPKVAQWFSGDWNVRNECAILTRNPLTKATETYRPDRVMLKGERAVVVDFKFGNPKKEHHSQVSNYMHLLLEMGYRQVEGFLWYVYTNQVVSVNSPY